MKTDIVELEKMNAAKVKDSVVSLLEKSIVAREKYEAEQAELEKLREAEEERKKQEEQKRIEELAKAAAEAAAQKKVKDAEDKAERERKEFEEREKQLEADRIAAAEKFEAEKIKAAEKAENDKNQAIDAEVQRQIKEKARLEREAAARAADTANRRKVNNEALAAFKKGGLDPKAAKLAVELIAKKMIANVVINY